jgi:hypothetical protein
VLFQDEHVLFPAHCHSGRLAQTAAIQQVRPEEFEPMRADEVIE